MSLLKSSQHLGKVMLQKQSPQTFKNWVKLPYRYCPFILLPNLHFWKNFNNFFQKVDLLPYIAFIFLPCAALLVHSLNVTAITSILLTFIVCARDYRNPFTVWQKMPKPVLYGLGAFLVWIMVTLLWAIDLRLSALKAIKVVTCIFFGTFLSVSLMQSTQEEKTARFFERGIVIALCLLVFEFASNYFIHCYILGYSNEGVWNKPNQPSGAVAIAMWPMVGNLLLKGQRALLGRIAFLALCVFSGANNEGTRAAFLIGLIIFGATYCWKEKFLRLVHIITLSGIAFSPFILVYVSEDWVLSHTNAKIQSVISLPHRLHIWKYCAQRILERPLKGHGIGSIRSDRFYKEASENSSPPNRNRYMDGFGYVWHPHNAVLEIWEDLGLGG
ncbi:MAG: O-antigen ligase family protein, partial [Holosporales bacterium]|nr:O-antigen ligase family protein [Holosporales bacterium]